MNSQNQTLADITRNDFPMFASKSQTQEKIIYLDHAATSQKPLKVIEALNDYYKKYNANVHRGAHQLSAQATERFEEARAITQRFINAYSSKEIVFTRNATEAINLVARSWGDKFIKSGDEILLTLMEHHSNLVPWQQLAKRTGCKLRHIGINKNGELDLEDLKSKLNKKTKLLGLVHISNTLGCCNPIEEIVLLAKKFDALVLLDACQSLAHQKIDVKKMNIDFLAGSSHKVCGPTGAGFLWGLEEHLNNMDPFLGGGEMIQEVFLDHSTWSDLPHKFEAGTPAIGEVIGMGEAFNYLESIGIENIQSWEKELIENLLAQLVEIEGLKILGPENMSSFKRGALATFNIEGIHSNDLSTILDLNGICIRSGHHCCQPLHRFYGLNSTARASLSFTTNHDEINNFIEELKSAICFLKDKT